jgi:hypothetical protein
MDEVETVPANSFDHQEADCRHETQQQTSDALRKLKCEPKTSAALAQLTACFGKRSRFDLMMFVQAVRKFDPDFPRLTRDAKRRRRPLEEFIETNWAKLEPWLNRVLFLNDLEG